MGALIELDRVEKTFVVRHKAGWLRRRKVEVRAVDRVSFEVPAGSMVGYIGPNRSCRIVLFLKWRTKGGGRGCPNRSGHRTLRCWSASRRSRPVCT
ncbi:MAG TPA: hypothetical protein VGJ86_23985 [Acidimicrobiales bacterium]